MEGMEQNRAIESDCFLSISKITVLINNITKMTKNPSIESELSQVLDDFLQKLQECDKYLENGIFNMNFAEAALLLQSSADLYSKKVDLLWDVIFDYQKRILLSEEQNGDKGQEIEKVEERKRKYKRKRKTNADEKENAKLVNNFSFGSGDNCDYLNQNYETVDLSKEWSKFNVKKHTDDRLNNHISGKKFLFLSDNLIHTEDNEYIGKYNQFHSTSLIEDIFHLEEAKLLSNDHNCVTQMRVDAYVINDFLFEKSIPSNKPNDSYSAELKEYVKNFIESHKQPEKTGNLSDQELQQIFQKKSVVCLERLPFNIMRDKLRRASLADSLFDDDQMNCPSPCHSIEDHNCDVTESLDKMVEGRSKSCSQDSAFYDDDDHDVDDDQVEEAPDVTNEATNVQEDSAVVTDLENSTCAPCQPETAADASAEDANSSEKNTTECPSETTAAEVDPDVVEKNDATEVSKTVTVQIPNVRKSARIAGKRQKIRTLKSSEVSDKSRVSTRQKIVKKWDFLLQSSEDEERTDADGEEEEEEIIEIVPKRRKMQKRKLSEKFLKKMESESLTVEHRDFELFCRKQYKAADGEGTVKPDLTDSEESEEEAHQTSDEEEEEEEEPEEEIVPSPTHSDEEMSDLEETNEDGAADDLEASENREESAHDRTTTPDLPDILHPAISPIPNLNTPSCSKTDLSTLGRTSTPHCKEIPLRNFSLSLETDFEDDIFRKNISEWRSFILPKLKRMENRADFDIHDYGSRIIEPAQIGEERSFKDIVNGKNSAEVARYFIATLQLANTHNVEITGAPSGELANNSFRIKTIDKTRHHEQLEDYQAPSEETFRERLERVKALNPRIPMHSTPSVSGPPSKRPKFSISSRKISF